MNAEDLDPREFYNSGSARPFHQGQQTGQGSKNQQQSHAKPSQQATPHVSRQGGGQSESFVYKLWNL